MKRAPQLINIDWEQARGRLARSAAATEAALQLSPEQVRQVLDDRATALACVPTAAIDAASTFEVLTFQLGQERYSIHTHLVREVLREPAATPVPGTPSFVLGIANLRGEMLAIIDLAEFFALHLQRREGLRWLIVVGVERAEFGIVCDEVSDVLKLRNDSLHLPPNSLAADCRELVTGVTSDALIVLDGEVLLSDPRLYIDDSHL
jgi:purine-binding chemotaxis protein CheW